MNTIHPTAIIYDNVELGDNNYIGPYCIIGAPAEHRIYWPKCGKVKIGNNNIFTGHVTIDAGTEQATSIGDNCFFMKGSHAGHDCVIADNVTVSCGARIGGHCVIGEHANIGLNAVIHQRQHIQAGCMIGMGSVLTKKLKTDPYKKYAGNPAKCIGDNEAHPNYIIFQKQYL